MCTKMGAAHETEEKTSMTKQSVGDGSSVFQINILI